MELIVPRSKKYVPANWTKARIQKQENNLLIGLAMFQAMYTATLCNLIKFSCEKFWYELPDTARWLVNFDVK